MEPVFLIVGLFIGFAAGCYCWNRFVTADVKSRLETAHQALVELGKNVKELY